MPELLTFGHGSLTGEELVAMLSAASVETVIDVRRFPASRSNPDVRTEALGERLPDHGIAYRWEERLGGRRQLARGEPVLDTWWTVPAFRAYAAHTRTGEFTDGLEQVLEEAHRRRVAVMCSESVWWRCHRRLVADVVLLSRQVAVQHLFATGRLQPHRPAPGARIRGDGHVVWDG
jgi:uncharacterized protein (DUF488 family)